MPFVLFLFAWIVLSNPISAANLVQPADGDDVVGETLYQARCGACHSIDANRIGPRHRGVFGRKAGGVEDYSYSPAVAASTINWDEETLNQWLENPQAFIPGQKMGFRLTKADERHDIIAYLKTQVETPIKN